MDENFETTDNFLRMMENEKKSICSSPKFNVRESLRNLGESLDNCPDKSSEDSASFSSSSDEGDEENRND